MKHKVTNDDIKEAANRAMAERRAGQWAGAAQQEAERERRREYDRMRRAKQQAAIDEAARALREATRDEHGAPVFHVKQAE